MNWQQNRLVLNETPTMLEEKLRTGRKTNMYKGPKTTMYIVRSLNMVNWLCSHGFKILKVEDSEKDEKLKVFFFEESPALHHTMMMYRKEV